MTFDLKSAVAYNRMRPYRREHWQRIVSFLQMSLSYYVRATDATLAQDIAEYQHMNGLTVDGKLGPHTERHMIEHGLVLDAFVVCDYCGEDKRQDELIPADESGIPVCKLCAGVDDDTPSSGYDAARAVHSATMVADAWPRLSVDQQREWIALYWGDDKPRSNWCGAFVACALEAGDVTVSPNTRRGAKRLTRWVAKHGRWVVSPEHVDEYLAAPTPGLLRAGDVLCWNRGTLSGLRDGQAPWQGHVALVLDVRNDGALDIAEGNVRDPVTGKRGQLVRRVLGPDEWLHRRKDGLRGVYGVARP